MQMLNQIHFLFPLSKVSMLFCAYPFGAKTSPFFFQVPSTHLIYGTCKITNGVQRGKQETFNVFLTKLLMVLGLV